MKPALLFFAATLAGGQTWVRLDTKLPEARLNAVAVRGTDQRIYLLGGVSESGFVRRVDIFDPATHRWSRGANLPTARSAFAAAVAPSGHIYVMGGTIDPARVTDTVEVYDPASNRWFGSAPLPTPRGGAAAVTGRDGRIYVMGGCGAGFPGESLATVEVFDPDTGEWTRAEPMPTARTSLAAAVTARGEIVAAGGMRLEESRDLPFAAARFLDRVEIYDPRSGRWREGTPLPSPRAWTATAFAAMKDERMVAVGGLRTGPVGGGSGTVLLDVVEAYDVEANGWIPYPSLPEPSPGLAAAAAIGNSLYVFGGYSRHGNWEAGLSREVLLFRGPPDGPRPDSRTISEALLARAHGVAALWSRTRSGLSKILPLL